MVVKQYLIGILAMFIAALCVTLTLFYRYWENADRHATKNLFITGFAIYAFVIGACRAG